MAAATIAGTVAGSMYMDATFAIRKDFRDNKRYRDFIKNYTAAGK